MRWVGERGCHKEIEDEAVARKIRQILNRSVKKSNKGRRCHEDATKESRGVFELKIES